ncbi:transmembrane protein 241 isoform X3 [Eublepharis macularius]|uniref:Transmembrane protein 241 isoform X3 n=1 Tax=Eublepharis macularius TaxID=481883 RepID=A0AA97JPN6_EUBMA|nr:transmembrane protein 241 isoform X3 [Eublepharis macularius]
MPLKRPAAGLTFCLLYLTSYFTNKYVLSVLKFTYPTLFQGWQTLVGGLLLHIFWKWGWVEISSSSRTEVISWLPASALFVGIIYSGSRALSRLPIPIFLTLHNAAEVITCGIEKFVQKEQISLLKICRVLILLVAAGCLPFCDPQFDADGYFWAVTHLLCVGAYKVFHKLWRPSSLSDSEQQYINYASRYRAESLCGNFKVVQSDEYPLPLAFSLLFLALLLQGLLCCFASFFLFSKSSLSKQFRLVFFLHSILSRYLLSRSSTSSPFLTASYLSPNRKYA